MPQHSQRDPAGARLRSLRHAFDRLNNFKGGSITAEICRHSLSIVDSVGELQKKDKCFSTFRPEDFRLTDKGKKTLALVLFALKNPEHDKVFMSNKVLESFAKKDDIHKFATFLFRGELDENIRHFGLLEVSEEDLDEHKEKVDEEMEVVGEKSKTKERKRKESTKKSFPTGKSPFA